MKEKSEVIYALREVEYHGPDDDGGPGVTVDNVRHKAALMTTVLDKSGCAEHPLLLLLLRAETGSEALVYPIDRSDASSVMNDLRRLMK